MRTTRSTRRSGLVVVLSAALLASTLSAAEAEPVPDEAEEATSPFDVERVGERVDVRDVEEPASLDGGRVERRLTTADELGDFSNPPLQGDALAKAELARATDIAAGRLPKDDSFDPDRSEKVDSATTSQAEVFDNSNGTRTAVLSAGRERFRDPSGDWVDLDLATTESASGGFRAAASDLDVEIPRDPSKEGLVVAGHGDARVIVGVPSSLEGDVGLAVPASDALSPNGHVEVNDARGVTAAVTLTTSGFEQQVTYPSRAAVTDDGYVLPIEVPEGWTVRQGAEGTNRVEFLDAFGELVATFGSGLAWDSTGESLAAARLGDAAIELLESRPGEARIRVSVASDWLDGAKFPVTIDPTYTYTITTSSTWADTFAQSDLGTAQENALFVAAGRSGPWAGTYMRFPLPTGGIPSPPGGFPAIPNSLAGVVSAELKVRVYSYAACNAAPLYARAIGSTWTPSTMTWSSGLPSPDGVFPTAMTTMQNPGCTEAWYSFFPRGSLQRQYDGSVGNHGLMIEPWSDMTANSRRLARSAEYGSNAAQLLVTYEWRPPTPTVVGPADEVTVTTTRPTLEVSPVTDGDGDTVKYWFKVWTNPDLPGAGQVVNSGWVTSPQWTPPAEYLVDGGTYYWNVVASDTKTVPTLPTATRTFSIDSHLGAGNLTDGLGPVGVDLTSGNGVVSVGGPGGVSLTYNTTDAPATGLTGYYYQDLDNDQVFDSNEFKLSRLDSTINFNWIWTTSPDPALTEDKFLVRWEGTVTVPQSGTWNFGTPIDDRARIWVNGTQVLNKWGSADLSESTVWGSGVALTAGTPYTIKIESHENTGNAVVNLQAKLPSSAYADGVDVPTNWLLPKERVPQQAPDGWWASVDAGGSPYTSVVATNDVAVVMSGDAAVLQFERQGTGFTPPESSEATLGQDDTGRYTLDEDGMRYVFNPDGTLAMSHSSVDDGAQVPKYTYTTISNGGKTYPRLASVTDPDTTRTVSYTWSDGTGTCPVASGYYTPPVGMICKAVDSDGATTEVYYSILGRITRFVADPDTGTSNDESITNLGYDACGRLSALRDPLSVQTVAAGYRANDDTTRWGIAYEPAACDGWAWDDKIDSVTAPEPTASDPRPTTEWDYSPGQTDTHVAGLTEPLGFARRVTYNSEGQLLTDTDATGLVTSYYYDTEGRLVSSVDPTGLKTTSIYNNRDLLTDEWGPAPSTYWTSASDPGAPTSGNQASTPRTTHEYDGSSFNPNLKGLGAAWFNTLTASPNTAPSATAAERETTLATGVGTTGGEIDKTWTSTAKPPGIDTIQIASAELNGRITFGAAGTYKLKMSRNQKVQVWIDDEQVITTTDWLNTDVVSTDIVTTGTNESRRIRIQTIANPFATTMHLKLWWDLPGGSTTWVTVPGTALSPDYGLETKVTDPDGRLTFYGYEDTAKNIGPHHGTPVTTNRHVSGFDFLTDTNIYTDPTIGDLEQTGRQLPTGAASLMTYENYGNAETADNPCTTGVTESINQYGAPKKRTDADPDGAGGLNPVTYNTVYDADGRVIAEWKNNDSPICTTHDSRGRPNQIVYPAYGYSPSRTVTHDYEIGGNPLLSSVSDSAGTITTMVDLLGRTVAYEDVWGTDTTVTYDQAGREAANASPAGTFTKTYDSAGRLETLELNGDVLAEVTYATGRPTRIDYPSGTGNAGNGTWGLFDYDTLGRLKSISWKQANGTMLTEDEVTSRSLAGLVKDNKIDGSDPYTAGDNFSYDGVGRLTAARTPGSHTFGYDFAATGGCGIATAAGKNTNRTAKTVDGGTPTTYCYNHADRLTSSSDSVVGTITYDNHGNSTGVFGESHYYDIADRHYSTVAGSTQISYGRDATDRIVSRLNGVVTAARYSYTASSDNPSLTLNSSGTVIEALISLPGGALLTTRSGGNVWSYPNLHGDIVARGTQAGAKDGSTVHYDPDGNLLDSATHPDNATGTFDYGWLGQHQRPREANSALQPVIEMGVRQYSARLGRFIEVDPISGGSCNAYEYACADPRNKADLDGRLVVGICAVVSVSAWFVTFSGQACVLADGRKSPIVTFAAGIGVGRQFGAGVGFFFANSSTVESVLGGSFCASMSIRRSYSVCAFRSGGNWYSSYFGGLSLGRKGFDLSYFHTWKAWGWTHGAIKSTLRRMSGCRDISRQSYILRCAGFNPFG